MTLNEFSLQFDIFYNNITSNQAPGLNEYEKSVFLTNAELQIVKEYFNQRTDSVGGGFDNSEIRQYDFSSIVRTENLFHINTFTERINEDEKLDKRSFVYLLPKNLFLFINEILYDDSNNQYSVIPIHYTEYQRLMSKPYNYPAKRNAWRMITDKKNCNYINEYITNTQCNYTFLSSWADQKRNISLTIRLIGENAETSTKPHVDNKTLKFHSEKYGNAEIETNCSWSGTSTYKIILLIRNGVVEDDRDIVELIKEGFKQYKDYCTAEEWKTFISSSNDVAKAITRTDGCVFLEAPNKYEEFYDSDGKTFITKAEPIPMVEIIGNFNKAPEYHMHYVVKPTPIILTDLNVYGTNVSIDGVQSATECILPEKMHHEILERAVALAKAAWQSTQA